MTVQEELKIRRAEMKVLVRNARIIATKFGVIAVTMLILVVYALFQNTQTTHFKTLAESNRLQKEEFVKRLQEDLEGCRKEIAVAKDRLTDCQSK